MSLGPCRHSCVRERRLFCRFRALCEAETPPSPAGLPSAHSDLSLSIVVNLLERTLSGAEGRMVPGVEARGWAELPV